MVRRSGPRFVTCLLASLLITHTPAAALTEVDVALVLAVDISNSMDPEEQALQREGFIAAFRSPLVHDAIRKGAHGRVAVTYMEWAGSVTQQVVVPWTIIEDSGAASELAGQLAAAPIRRAPRTSISAAIDYSVLLLEGSGVEAARRVIDISGDGANNEGRPVTNARNEALDRGIVINGLPIMLKRGGYWDIEHLDLYYRDCVIGGLGAFMVPIRERQAVRGGGHRCGLRTARGALRWAATHDCACQNRRVVRRPVHVSNHVNAERRWRTRQSGSDCGSCRCSGDPAQRFLAT